MRFVLATSLIVSFLATDCCGQTTNETSTKQEPPKLELAFSDDFVEDTRGDYSIDGEVAWEQGKLTLAEGASLTGEINGGSWAELELDLQFPELTKDGETSDLRIWFDLGDRATDCYLSFSQQRSQGKVASIIRLCDSDGQVGETPSATLIRPMSINGPLAGGSWKLKYRYGLVTVVMANADSFFAYIANNAATLRSVVLECETQICSFGGITAYQLPRIVREYTEQEKKQISRFNQALAKFPKLYGEGKYGEAAAIGEEALKIAKSVYGEYHPSVSTSLGYLALPYRSKRDYTRAEPLYKQALEIRKTTFGENHPSYADGLIHLALMYMNMRDYARAEPLYKQALEIRKTTFGENHSSYASSLDELAELFKRMSDYPRAELLYKQALEIRKSTLGEDHTDFAKSLHELALLYERIGDYPQAEPLYKQALEVLKLTLGENHPSYVTVLDNLAGLYMKLGDYPRSKLLLNQALEITKSTLGEDHPGYAHCLTGLALLYQSMGDYPQAEPLYMQALEIKKSTLGEDNAAYADDLNSLAQMYAEMGDHAHAEPLFKQALEITKSTLGEDHPFYATGLNNLASLYQLKGDYPRAVSPNKQALEVLKLTLGENHPSYATSLSNLASLYELTGDYPRAEPLFKGALEIRKSTLGEDHPDYASSLNALAGLYLKKGDYTRAEPLYSQAIGIVQQMLDANSLVQSERQQKRNQFEKRFYLDTQLATSLRTDSCTDEVLKTLWQWKGAVTIRQQAYRALAANPDLAPLFESLQSVSRQLSVATTQKPISPSASADTIKQENFQHRRDLWEERFAKLNRTSENLQQQIANGSSEFRELQEPLTVVAVQEILPAGTAFVDFLEYEYSEPHPDKKGKLKGQQSYIAFVVTKDREPAMIGLGSADLFREAIDAFRRPFVPEQNTTANRETAMKAGRQLRKELWVPIEQHLDGIETVIISPDTALGTLPWSALPGRKANSFLLEDYRLASIPFANLLPRLMREQSTWTNNHGLLVVGNIDYDSQLDAHPNSESALLTQLAMEQGIMKRTPGKNVGGQWKSLPGFQNELDAIQSLHRSQFGTSTPIKTLSGTSASETELLQNASRFSTLHLITHGYFEDPVVKSIDQAEIRHDTFSSQLKGPDPFVNTWLPGLLSGLVMAGANQPVDDPQDLSDGILRASEIEATSLQGVDLVVLSACDTGLGAVAGGEGLTGLQRAFQIAGAKTVVASLWKVDDRATQELMQRFYENLWIKKMSKIDALREAQLWMLRHPKDLEAMGVKNVRTRGEPRDPKPTITNPTQPNSNGKTDPYFWAAFQLSGDWR